MTSDKAMSVRVLPVMAIPIVATFCKSFLFPLWPLFTLYPKTLGMFQILEFYPTWRAGMFPLDIWDMFNCETRTNNSVEAFHLALKTFITQAHLTIYKFATLFFTTLNLSPHSPMTLMSALQMGIRRRERTPNTLE